MPALGATAHFRAKGDRNAHVQMSDALENRGYALWLACQGKIRTSKSPKVFGPPDRGVGAVLGYEIEVNLKRKCFDSWPGLNQMDKVSQDAFISEIYSYLRASGNAICVRQPGLGQHGIPLWWIRESWNDVKAVGIYRPTELTSREKRLTPREAGEDREPSPVTVRMREEAAAAREAERETPEQVVKKTQSRAEDIVAVIKASPQPLYQREIAEAIGITTLTAGRVLRELEEAGTIYRRQESRGERPDDASGRYRYLYWHKKTIPIRHAPMDIGNQTMERVWAMKPGETLATKWMSPGNQQQVAQMVQEGLLEYINQGTDEERIKLAPATPALEVATEETKETPAPEPEKAPEPPKPAPPEKSLPATEPMEVPDLGDISAAIERLVGERVQRQIERLEHQLRDEKNIRQRLEASLIEARSELSVRTGERDRLQAQLDGIRKQLGL